MCPAESRPARLACGEHLGEVTNFDRDLLAMERAAELHQASAIVGDEDLGAAFAQTRDLVLGHRGRDLRELDREHPAEAAALLGITKIDELQSVDVAEQEARLIADAELAHQMARRM